jgi:putative transposase
MLKAIKIRIYPTDNQEVYINKLLGTCRYIYNNLLAFKKQEYEEKQNNISFGQLGKHLTELKIENEWIKDSHSKVLQQSMVDLDKAYKNFFKEKKGYPKFKSKKDNKQSCRFPIDAISGINGNRINLITQLKNIHYKCSRKDEKYLNKYKDNIRSATLSKTKSGKYYLSILIDGSLTPKLSQPTNQFIGIDLGIKDFVITSDGETYDNIKIKRNNEKKLIKLHKELSKKQKGSNNRNKAKIKLAKAHEKLNNIKENYLHSIINQLLNENQVIIMEDLNIKGMMKNHKLAKSIQELSLYRFKEILKYKAKWFNKEIIEIDRYFPSSKLCSKCGYKNEDLTLKDRAWVCPHCGQTHDRDINASINILNEGKRIYKETIGLSSSELTLVENTTLVGSLKQEKNVFH